MLTKRHDSLYYLNDWRLPYPVYRFCTGDVDGDGKEDALVGVVKSTRFYPEKGRRIFIFKQVNGKARPLWLGSRLGGQLVDFSFADGKVRALEKYDDSRFVVTEWQWKDFGLQFTRYIAQPTDKNNALKYFRQ